MSEEKKNDCVDIPKCFRNSKDYPVARVREIAQLCDINLFKTVDGKQKRKTRKELCDAISVLNPERTAKPRRKSSPNGKKETCRDIPFCNRNTKVYPVAKVRKIASACGINLFKTVGRKQKRKTRKELCEAIARIKKLDDSEVRELRKMYQDLPNVLQDIILKKMGVKMGVKMDGRRFPMLYNKKLNERNIRVTAYKYMRSILNVLFKNPTNDIVTYLKALFSTEEHFKFEGIEYSDHNSQPLLKFYCGHGNESLIYTDGRKRRYAPHVVGFSKISDVMSVLKVILLCFCIDANIKYQNVDPNQVVRGKFNLRAENLKLLTCEKATRVLRERGFDYVNPEYENSLTYFKNDRVRTCF